MGVIAENLSRVRQQIEEAAIEAGRSPGDITLVGVSKFHPYNEVNEALAAGLRDLGENRAQELCGKYGSLVSPEGFNMHFIGHLQTNKVKQIIGFADLIQSVDSLKLLDEIDRQAKAAGKIQDVLIELNISGEKSKTGAEPAMLDGLLCHAGELSCVRVRGLMGMAPLDSPGDKARPYFAGLYKLFVDMRVKKYDNVSMDIVSMGMSGDFKAAIAEGSTMVRIGTAIFGSRV